MIVHCEAILTELVTLLLRSLLSFGRRHLLPGTIAYIFGSSSIHDDSLSVFFFLEKLDVGGSVRVLVHHHTAAIIVV